MKTLLMPLEAQVCSLELAKSLEELGVKQESLWCYAVWNESMESPIQPCPMDTLIYHNQVKEFPGTYICSAFTVAELGEMLLEFGMPLPVYNYTDKAFYYKIPKNVSLKTKSWGESQTMGIEEINYGAITEANARAKMLIYLIEKGLVQVKK